MDLNKFCTAVNNWDFIKRAEKKYGKFSIEGGAITNAPEELAYGQYYRIVGSLFNDGVHQFGIDDLRDENFNGSVWLMAVPSEVLDLVDEISKWEKQNADILNNPYNSESYGGYSYTKDPNQSTWQKAFSSALSRWRKI